MLALCILRKSTAGNTIRLMKLLRQYQYVARNPKREIGVPDASRFTGVPAVTIRANIKRGQLRLKARRVENPRGHYYLIKVRDLLEYSPAPRGRRLDDVALNGSKAKSKGKKKAGRKVKRVAGSQKKKPMKVSRKQKAA